MTGLTAARTWGTVTAVVGGFLVFRPRTAVGLVSTGASAPNPIVVQALGGRQLLQGLVVLRRPDVRALLTGGSIVDVVHSASMLAAASWWPRYRRPALASATVAGLSALTGGLISRRSGR